MECIGVSSEPGLLTSLWFIHNTLLLYFISKLPTQYRTIWKDVSKNLSSVSALRYIEHFGRLL